MAGRRPEAAVKGGAAEAAVKSGKAEAAVKSGKVKGKRYVRRIGCLRWQEAFDLAAHTLTHTSYSYSKTLGGMTINGSRWLSRSRSMR
jgi:hypothetical protein